MKRFRSFYALGYPTWRIAFGLVALVVGGIASRELVLKAMRPGSLIFPLEALFAIGLTAIGLLLLAFAARRILVGHDGAIEIDPAARKMLVLSRHAQPVVLAFGEISHLTVSVTDQPYTSGRLVRTVQIVAAPSGTVLLTEQAETMFTRDGAVMKMRSLAQRIGALLGVSASQQAGAAQPYGPPSAPARMDPNWAAAAVQPFLDAEGALRAMHGPDCVVVRPQVWTNGGYPLAAAGWELSGDYPAILPHHLDLLLLSMGDQTMARRPSLVFLALHPHVTEHAHPVPHVVVRLPASEKPRLIAELARQPEHAPTIPSPPRPVVERHA